MQLKKDPGKLFMEKKHIKISDVETTEKKKWNTERQKEMQKYYEYRLGKISELISLVSFLITFEMSNVAAGTVTKVGSSLK